MKPITTTISSLGPALLCSRAGMDKDHPLQVRLDKLIAETSGAKAKKETPEQRAKKKWLQFQLAIHDYWDEASHQIFIPAEMMEASLREGAKNWKLGEAVKRGVLIEPSQIPLIYTPQHQSLAQIFGDPQFVDFRPAKKLMLCRPILHTWKAEFTIFYDYAQIQADQLKPALEYAGKYKGIFTYRPVLASTK